MISKQEFLKQVEKNTTPNLKNEISNLQEIERKLKIFSILLYIAGVIFMCFIWDIPKRDIKENMDIFFKIGDYLSFLFPVLIIPVFPPCLVCGMVYLYYEEKCKNNYTPFVYSALGIQKAQKDKNSIEKLQDIGLLPAGNLSIDDSFKIQDSEHNVSVQEVEISSNNHKMLFWGPVVIYKLDYSYPATTLIIDKTTTELPLWLQNYAQKLKWEKIALEDINFMKKYQIFGLDQIRSRAILTPIIMERLQELHNIYQAPVNVLFIKNKLILAIDTNRDMFEFITSDKKFIKERYKNFYDEISALFNFEKILKLK